MLQAVIDNTLEGHPESEARTATEVSHLYGLLASLFRAEPTAELLKALRSDELQPLLADSDLTLDDDLLGETEDQALIEKLAIEFTALFLGPGGHISPHESVHASQRGGILWGEETVKVKRYIESLGMTFSEEYQGLPDHISVELDLMANLAGHEARAWERRDHEQVANALEYQHEFMRDHLLRWVPIFCRKVIETAEIGFYRGVARVTRDFLASEAEDLQRRRELVGSLQAN